MLGDIELRRNVCKNEVIEIIADNNERKAVITSLDSRIYLWNYSGKM